MGSYHGKAEAKFSVIAETMDATINENSVINAENIKAEPENEQISAHEGSPAPAQQNTSTP